MLLLPVGPSVLRTRRAENFAYLGLHPNSRLSFVVRLLPSVSACFIPAQIATSTDRITTKPDVAIRLVTCNHYT